MGAQNTLQLHNYTMIIVTSCFHHENHILTMYIVKFKSIKGLPSK